jgi:hypothetical protein
MNDLTSLRELGETIDTELRGPTPALRRRVVADLGRPPRRVPGRAWARPRLLPGWRLAVSGLRLAAAGVVAVALVAGLLVVSTLRLLGAPPGATAQAATILDRAAAAAARQPALHPRPSQYIFISGLGIGSDFSDTRFTGLTADLHQAWFSVSGTRNGLVRDQPRSPANLHRAIGPWQSSVIPGCRPGRPDSGVSRAPASGQPVSARPQPVASTASPQPAPSSWQILTPGSKTLAPAHSGPCRPKAADPVLPTSPDAMLNYLYRTREGNNPPAVEAFIHAGDLISQSYLRPAELVALFGALKRLPGISVVPHAVSLIGQRGIAVQQVYHGESDQLIFNARSYAFIGNREVSVSPTSGVPVGGVLGANAVLRIAVVDRAGQLP